MSFSTNPTNPLSAYNMTSNNLTAGNLRNMPPERANRSAYSSESESDDEVKVTAHKTSMFKSERKRLLDRNIKPMPNSKYSFSLKSFLLSFCCIR